MSDANLGAADQRFSCAKARSNVWRKVSAVTRSFEGGENRYADRTRNVYVRPSEDTAGIAAAISGWRCVPLAPVASG